MSLISSKFISRNTNQFKSGQDNLELNVPWPSTEQYLTISPAGVLGTKQAYGYFNVMDYGADPTGVADATASTQACIDAAVAMKTNAFTTTETASPAVYFPSGVYKISSMLTTRILPANAHSAIRFFGDGWRNSIIRCADGASFDFFFDFPATGTDYPTRSDSMWEFHDLHLDGELNSKQHHGINAMKSSYWNIQRCHFSNLNEAIRMRNWSTTVLNNRFSNCTYGANISKQAGIAYPASPTGTDTTVNDLIFMFNKFGGCEHGIYVDAGLDVNYLNILHNELDACTRAGIYISGTCDHLNIVGNYFEANNPGNAYQLTVWKNEAKTVSTNIDGVCIALQPIQGGLGSGGMIHDNLFISVPNKVISLSAHRTMKIYDNTLSGPAAAGGVNSAFVAFEDPSAHSNGPMAFNVCSDLLIDQSLFNAGGTRVVDQIAKWSSLGTTAPERHAGLQIIKRAPMVSQTCRVRPFWLADISNAALFVPDTASVSPVKMQMPDGMPGFHFELAAGVQSVYATLTKTSGSNLSGQWIKVFGLVESDSIGGCIFDVEITDGARAMMRIRVQPTTTGEFKSTRGESMYLEEVTGATTETVVIRVKATTISGDEFWLHGFCICSAAYSQYDYPQLQA